MRAAKFTAGPGITPIGSSTSLLRRPPAPRTPCCCTRRHCSRVVAASAAKDSRPAEPGKQKGDAAAGATAELPAATLPRRHDAKVLFAIPPAQLTTPMTEVLACPTMRELLGPPRPSPLSSNLTGVWEGKFVDDADRVALNVMDFASPDSTGAGPVHFGYAGSTATTALPLSSGVFGSTLAGLDTQSVDGGAAGGGGGGPDVCMPLPPFALRAGPRDSIFFDPATVTAAIVTTGNICPGMNDVIESMVKRLWDYGVPEDNVLGIRYGMRGFRDYKDAKPMVLTRDKIDGIHLMGGTILGTSNDHRLHRRRHIQAHLRHLVAAQEHQQQHQQQQQQQQGSSPGSSTASTSPITSSDEDGPPASPASQAAAAAAAAGRQGDELEHILDKLEFWRINILLVIGGQGGNQLAAQLAAGCQRRRIPCCVAGVPKSIDNDVMLLDKTFGFETVVQEVNRPLLAAKVEAASARKGVGLVKVFGRRSGFIALQASLASGVVDVCLIPEESFELDGPAGLLEYVRTLIEQNGHCVICVSEGAGQDLLYGGGETVPVDEAGNPLLRDVGAALKKAIKGRIPDADIKYIDPTYMVQAVPCSSQDHIFCRVLGMHAVDAAFGGYTGVMVGQVNGHFVLLPSAVVTQSARRVDPKGKSWNRLRGAIGQPRFRNDSPADMPPDKVAKL